MAVEKQTDCRFVRVSDERAVRSVGLARLKHRFPTRAQSALVEQLRAQAKQLLVQSGLGTRRK
jgi:hypothetical protein